MIDEYEYIHKATDDKLADMLDAKARGVSVLLTVPVFDDENESETYGTLVGEIELFKEAAARLRKKHKYPFNNEAFE